MHNMLIIATNHLSMLTVYVRHRDPNCPAPSPRLLCCHISRGGMATLPRNTFITFPQFASQSQGHRTHSAVTFKHRRLWSDRHYRKCRHCLINVNAGMYLDENWLFMLNFGNYGKMSILHFLFEFIFPYRIAGVFNARLHLQN